MKTKGYVVPKTFVYSGEHREVSTKILHYHYDANTLKVTNNFKPLDLPKHYIQVVGLNDIKKIQQLNEYYPIDALILEDVFNVRQRNKIEIKPNYVFGVFHLDYLHEGKVTEDYMSVLLFKDTLISFHEVEPTYLHLIHGFFESLQEIKSRPVDYVLFQILDIITDNHIDVFEDIEIQMSNFEGEILESSHVNQEAFYLLRKRLLRLKNSVSPTLEQLERTTDHKTTLLNEVNANYFEDLIDHLKRLDSQVNQARELMRNLLDLQINNQSNKMNRIMTTLTLFSAIFIPLSFLTGFFGMNFVYFEVLAYEHALGIFVGLCLMLAGFMVFLFKKMKWF